MRIEEYGASGINSLQNSLFEERSGLLVPKKHHKGNGIWITEGALTEHRDPTQSYDARRAMLRMMTPDDDNFPKKRPARQVRGHTNVVPGKGMGLRNLLPYMGGAALLAACGPAATDAVSISAGSIPTATPSIVRVAPEVVSTSTPTVGDKYSMALTRVGVPSDAIQIIVSLPDTNVNRQFLDEVPYVGDRAIYANPRMVQRALKMLEDGVITPEELAEIKDLDNDGLLNRDEMRTGTNILDRFNRLPPTPESLVVLDNMMYALVAGNDVLTYAFTPQNFRSLLAELEHAPHGQELLRRVSSVDPKENVSRAWNYKVRREDDVLCEIPRILTENRREPSSIDCNSDEVIRFRVDNGSHHLEVWKDGGILPLDDQSLSDYFEKREDEEFVVARFWVPNGMLVYDASQRRHIGQVAERIPIDDRDYGSPMDPKLMYQTLRNNMDVIQGKIKLDYRPELMQFKDLRDRIERVAEDSTINSGIAFGRDQEEALYYWGRQERIIPWLGWIDTPTRFSNNLIPILEQRIPNFKLVKIAYGLAMLDLKDVESIDTLANQVYQKAIGYTAFEQYAENPIGFGTHQYVSLPISKDVALLLPDDTIVYKGQTISPYSMKGGLETDGALSVRLPR